MTDPNDSLRKYRQDIVNFIEPKNKREFKITGNFFDSVTNILTNELPYGKITDKAHVVLTNAVIFSLWCGWFSQARTNAKDPNYKPEYIEQYKNWINAAFEVGKKYASDRP
jgi:hypothetical protein